LLEHGASPSQGGRNDFPPLVFLARGDKGEHPEKIEILLEYGAAVDALGPKGQTALHLAASAGYLKVMKLLLDHGANPELRDRDGKTALSLARAAGKADAVKLLEEYRR
jgi:ankyrin repeat protein